MIRTRPTTEDETKRSRGIMDLAPRRGNIYDFDPRLLRIEPGFNARLINFNPDDEEDLRLARSIAEIGVKQPLVVWMKDGEPTVTDGHRRLNATLYAMDVLGAPIKSIPVRVEPKQASEVDRAFTVLVSDESRHLAPIERANHYAKLIGYGETEASIAARIGRSRQHVADLLNLRAGPMAVVEMVKMGRISATLAKDTLREARGDGEAATAALYEGLKKAKAEGKTKATRKDIVRPPPDLTKSVGYQAGMRHAVEMLRDAGMSDAADLVEAATPG